MKFANASQVARTVTALIAVLTTLTLGSVLADETSQNRAPTAHTGHGQTAVIGQRVTLDATGSTDRDGDRLTYNWTLLQAPSGSAAQISDAAAVRPEFVVDLLGSYHFELVVGDGKLQSKPVQVVVTTGNSAPVAVAEQPLWAQRGEAVRLSSAASWDPDGDSLTARWSILQRPAASRAALAGQTNATATLQVDAAGDYLVQLVVSDGVSDSAPVVIALSTDAMTPRAAAGDDLTALWNTSVRLSGGQSMAAPGQALGYRWSLLHAPHGSRTTLTGSDTPAPSLRPDRPGVYVAQLIVSDDQHDSAPDTVVIDVRAPAGAADWAAVRAQAAANILGSGGTDVDGDGVPDDVDNCVDRFNPDQRDTNGDGFGNICDADLDNDGFVTNTVDLGLLRLAFFSTPASPNWNPDADFNGDNFVNAVDLGVLRSYFFGPPGPIVNRFINPAGGDWHDANNWSRGVVPNIQHAVRIDLAPGTVVEYSAGSSAIASMRTTSDFLLSGGTLSVNKTMQVNAPFTLTTGTLSNAEVLAPLTSDALVATASGTLNNVTLGGELIINNGVFLTIQNDLTLAGGTVTLASTGSATYLAFSGGANTLGGTGEVVYSGSTNSDNTNQIYGNTSSLTIGPNVTVRSDTTGGFITSFSNPLFFQGTLISNLAGRTMRVTPGTGSVLEGSMTASGGGHLVIDGYTAGAYTLGAGAIINVTDGDLDLFGTWLNQGQINVTNGVFDTGSLVTEEWDNDGVITLVNTPTQLGGRVTVAGMGTFNTSGDVTLDGLLDNTGLSLDVSTISGNFILTTGEIEGGTIINTPLTATGNGTFDGVTLATGLTISNGVFFTIQNDLILAGGTVTLASTGSASYLAFSGGASTLGGNGEVVYGGSTNSDSANQIYGNTSSLTIGPDVTVRSDTTGGFITSFSNPLFFQGTLISNLAGRTMRVTPGTGSVLEGSMTASGGGHLVIDGYTAGAFTLGAGAIINVTDGDLDLFGTWLNLGQINVTNGVFDTGNQVVEQWDNDGVITLVNTPTQLGGRVTVAGMGTFNTSGDVTLDGVLDNTGLSLDVSTISGNFFLTTGEIEGGTIINTPLTATGNGRFDGVTLATGLTISNGVFFTIQNDLILAGGTVTLATAGSATYLAFSGGASTLGGNGEVVYSGSTNSDSANQIYGNTSSLTIGPNVTVRSDTTGGFITSFSNPLFFQGTLISNLAGRTMRVTPGTGSVLEGSMTASGGGHLLIDGYTAGAYTLGAGAIINVTDGDLDLFGTWLNQGQINVTNGVFDTGNQVTEEWDNDGVITLVNTPTQLGGRVTVAGMGTFNTSGDVTLDGVLDNTGLSLDVSTISGNFFLTTGEIEGGTIINTPLTATGNGRFDGVTLATGLTINNGVFFTIQNDLILAGGTVTLASTGSATYLAFSGGASTLGGNGEVVYGGSTNSDSTNQIYGNIPSLTIAPNVTVRTDTTGGLITVFSNPLLVQGTLIANAAGRNIALTAGSVTVDGTLTMGSESNITTTSATLDLAASAIVNIDMGPAGTGQLRSSTGTISVAGALNLALVDGLMPAPCDRFILMQYRTVSGNFAVVNGPDFGGDTFGVLPQPFGMTATTPGSCVGNMIYQLASAVTTSSDFSTSYLGPLAVDGINATNSSWCTANNDPSPAIRVDLFADVTVEELRITTTWSPTYDFLTGRFLLRNAADVVVYDSGIVALTSGAITLDVVPDVANVRSVEFLGVTWNSIEPCLSELEAIGF